jgi:AraC-like DNA-binding protein
MLRLGIEWVAVAGQLSPDRCVHKSQSRRFSVARRQSSDEATPHHRSLCCDLDHRISLPFVVNTTMAAYRRNAGRKIVILFTEESDMDDELSVFLRMVRLSGGVFLSSELGAPWSVSAAVTAQECVAFNLEPRHIVAYHYVVAGEMYIAVDGQQPSKVEAGEIVMLPQNDAHILSSAPGLPPMPGKVVLPSPVNGISRMKFGGTGERCQLLCGFLSSDDFNPLFMTLPKVLKIDVAALGNGGWIESSMQLAIAELSQGQAASSNMMARLSELLFIEAVRSYARTAKTMEDPWLRGLGDAQIGRILSRMHQSVASDWTVDALAREAGLSRTAFINRFAAATGQPPMSYLKAWRLREARLRLLDDRECIAQIGHAVGYRSEEAFSRAFKRVYGVAPGHYQKRATNAA